MDPRKLPFEVPLNSSLIRDQDLAERMMDFALQSHDRWEKLGKLVGDAIQGTFPQLFSVSVPSFLSRPFPSFFSSFLSLMSSFT